MSNILIIMYYSKLMQGNPRNRLLIYMNIQEYPSRQEFGFSSGYSWKEGAGVLKTELSISIYSKPQIEGKNTVESEKLRTTSRTGFRTFFGLH